MTEPWARPPQQPGPPPPHFSQGPGQPPAQPSAATPEEGSSLPAKMKKIFSDPVSIVLVVVIVLALVFACLLGA
ncbi:DUF2993 domain-containing protein, partial [Mycobacterium sp. ITM-2017-0098]